MNTPNEDDLGFDRLDKMVEYFKSKPIFEDSKWNQVLAELGRISVYFDMLSFNLKCLLITLERPDDLGMNTGGYAYTDVSKVIKKCRKALSGLESGVFGKQPKIAKLFKDCRQQLARCNQLRKRRNELIHALWFSQAFGSDSVTRIGMAKPKTSGDPELKVQEHNPEELRAVALEIRNARFPLHTLMVKLRIATQQASKA